MWAQRQSGQAPLQPGGGSVGSVGGAPGIGVQVAGTARLTRPIFSPGGNIEAAGNASATMKETQIFLEPGDAQLLRVEDYFILTGLLSVASDTIGSNMTSFGQGAYKVTSNLFPTVFEQLTSISVMTPDLSKSTKLPFIAIAEPNGELTVEVTLAAFGRASVNGADFGVHNVGIGTAPFDGSFEHTLSWGGITSVTDATTGVPILDWSVNSASGFDFSQSFELAEPVPVPPALVNMLAGLVFAGWIGRRRAMT